MSPETIRWGQPFDYRRLANSRFTYQHRLFFVRRERTGSSSGSRHHDQSRIQLAFARQLSEIARVL